MDASHDIAGQVQISAERARIDFDLVYGWISTHSYWARGIPRDVFDRAVAGSICFGASLGARTVGFARVISDRATFAYLSDVFVDPEHRRRGISKAIVQVVMAHPELQALRRWSLVTRNAHGLYTPFGFTRLAASERHMERVDADIYLRRAAGDP